jgi:hypothetical protein
MLTGELRHMDGIKGNFSIVDGRDYQATAAVKEGDLPQESVLTTARAFVISGSTRTIVYNCRLTIYCYFLVI